MAARLPVELLSGLHRTGAYAPVAAVRKGAELDGWIMERSVRRSDGFENVSPWTHPSPTSWNGRAVY